MEKGDRGRGLIGWAVLILLPAVMLLASRSLMRAKGPYWLGTSSDPDYVYLLNGLALSQGESIGHFDHPGTPVQVWMAGVIRAVNAVGGDVGVVADVLGRPEEFLRAGNWSMLAALAAVMVFAGAAVWRGTGRLPLGVAVQGGVLAAWTCLEEMVCVKPEPLLMAEVLAVVGVVAGSRWTAAGASALRVRGVIGVGILCGIAVATKVTAAPLMALPLVVVAGWGRRVALLAAVGVGFAVATIPAWRGLAVTWQFSSRIATHTGRYGSGAEGAIAGGNVKALGGILAGQPWLDVVLVVAAAVFVWAWWSGRGRERSAEARFAGRFLLGAVGVMAGSVVLVAKQPYEARYLVPGLAMTGAAVAGCIWVVSLARRGKGGAEGAVAVRDGFVWREMAVAVGAAVVLGGLGWWGVESLGGRLRAARNGQMRVVGFVAKHVPGGPGGKAIAVTSYRGSSQPYALYFGNNFTRSTFSRDLEARYPGTILWDPWGRRPVDFSNTTARWPAGKEIYLHGGWLGPDQRPKFEKGGRAVHVTPKWGGETVFRVYPDTSQSERFGGYEVVGGLGVLEGPFPQWGLPVVCWTTARRTTLAFDGGAEGGQRILRMSYRRGEGERVGVSVRANGGPVLYYGGVRTDYGFTDAAVEIAATPGRNEVVIEYLAGPGEDKAGVIYQELRIE